MASAFYFEENGSTNKVKNTLKQAIYHFFLFHLTHILEISRFEITLSRFFWSFFQNLQISMFWGLAGQIEADDDVDRDRD